MRAHIVENGIVTNTIEVESLDFLPGLVSAESGGAIGDRYENGEFLPPLPPAKSPEEIRREIMDGVQRYLDDFARTKTYDSMLSACTYATSTVPQFAKEGQYCVEKRDECWATVARIEAEVLAGTRPAPTGFDDIRGELPVLEWPAA